MPPKLYLMRHNPLSVMSIRGVITGDVINSTGLSVEQRKELLSALSAVADEIRAEHPLEYEFYRGDGIQIVVEDPADTLLVGVLLRAGLRGSCPENDGAVWDVRLSLGVGGVEAPDESIAMSDGEAFRLSGRGLDSMGKATLRLSTPWKDVNDEFSVSLAFADDVVCGWTSNHARVVYRSLMTGLSQKDLALELGRSAQIVSRALILAKEKLMRNLLRRFAFVIASKTRQLPCLSL